MELRASGRLGRVSALTLGGGGIGGVWGATDRSEAVATVHAALDGGINMLDLAPSYGTGFESELAVADALRGHDSDVMITSKVQLPDDDGRDFAKRIRRSLHSSLIRLERRHLDVLVLHTQFRRQGTVLSGTVDPAGYRDEIVPVFESLRDEGLIRAWGITAVGDPEPLLEAFGAAAGPPAPQPDATGAAAGSPAPQPDATGAATGSPAPQPDATGAATGSPAPQPEAFGAVPRPDTAQIVVNALDQSGDLWIHGDGVRPDNAGLVRAAASAGITVTAIRAVAAGSLADALDRSVPADHPAAVDFARAAPFRALAASFGESAASLAHRYALSVPGVTTVILGVKNRTELAECLAAEARGPLTADELKAISALTD
ncbi:aldo/keto reductase [Actinoplanes sp. NPDC026670]|uniref:aldo/keto reductase n=1 Tax=Actinoplanes sp. NPDC026670 TaxID=3154700 RepID=UPI0033CF2AC4